MSSQTRHLAEGRSNTVTVEVGDPRVNAVLDLIKMTNQGKLRWKRSTDPSMHTDEFKADLGRKLLLLRSIPSSLLQVETSFLSTIVPRSDNQRVKDRTYPYLWIYADSHVSTENLLVSFPDIAPLRALLTAVESQLDQVEIGILEEIHAAAETA